MKFNELSEKHIDYTIRGQFEDSAFNTSVYEQELYMLGVPETNPEPLHKRITNNARGEDPDISYQLAFNEIDGHDGRFPMFASMRDWWPLPKRNSSVSLITKRLGGTSTLHTDDLAGRECHHCGTKMDRKRFLIFLTDWAPGQVWFIKEQVYTGWKTGTVLDLDFTEAHGNANSSHTPMTFMQLTLEQKI
jgi:hypothetical protein